MLGFVVEGFNDEIKLRQLFPDAQYAVTKGTRFTRRVRMDVQNVITSCEKVYLITDPDDAGELLADYLLREFPTLVRVELDPKECKCMRFRRLKIGLEHASLTYIQEVLSQYTLNVQKEGVALD